MMCGRYTLKTPANEIFQQLLMFGLASAKSNFSCMKPRYNIAPNQKVLAIRCAEEEGKSNLMMGNSFETVEIQWGRGYTRGQYKRSVINTRVETLKEKMQVGYSANMRPCLIVADGYYEWKKSEGSNIPYYIYRKDHQLLLFVGVWQQVGYAKTPPIDCCTIVTCRARNPLDEIHERMPLFTEPTTGMKWLTQSSNFDRCHTILQSCSGESLQMHTVHTQVNHVGFEHFSCVDPTPFHRQKSLF